VGPSPKAEAAGMQQLLIVLGAAFVLALASTFITWRPTERPGVRRIKTPEHVYIRLRPTSLFLVLPRRLCG
jgi:hypothetical protein